MNISQRQQGSVRGNSWGVTLLSNVKLYALRKKMHIICDVEASVHGLSAEVTEKTDNRVGHKKPDHFSKFVIRVYDDAERWSIYETVQGFI